MIVLNYIRVKFFLFSNDRPEENFLAIMVMILGVRESIGGRQKPCMSLKLPVKELSVFGTYLLVMEKRLKNCFKVLHTDSFVYTIRHMKYSKNCFQIYSEPLHNNIWHIKITTYLL